MSEFTQGVCADGAAILKDGVMLTIEEIIELLRQSDKLMGRGEPVGYVNDYQLDCIESKKTIVLSAAQNDHFNTEVYAQAPAVKNAVVYICHRCKSKTNPPDAFKMYVHCDFCGSLTSATAAEYKPEQNAPAVDGAVLKLASKVIDMWDCHWPSILAEGFHEMSDAIEDLRDHVKAIKGEG